MRCLDKVGVLGMTAWEWGACGVNILISRTWPRNFPAICGYWLNVACKKVGGQRKIPGPDPSFSKWHKKTSLKLAH